MPIFDRQSWDTPLERGFYWLESESDRGPASLIDIDTMPSEYLIHVATAYGVLPLYIDGLGPEYNRRMLHDAAEMCARIGQPRAWDLHIANLGGDSSYQYFFDDSGPERVLQFIFTPDSGQRVNGEYPVWYEPALKRSWDFLLDTVFHSVTFGSETAADAGVGLHSEIALYDYVQG